MEKEQEDTQYILAYEGIGDWCFTLAYLRNYQERNHVKIVTILTANPTQEVFDYFTGLYDDIKAISASDRDSLIEFFKSDLWYIYRQKYKKIMPLFPMTFVRSDLLIKNSYVSFLDIFRGMLRIEKESKPYIPDAIPAEDLIERLKANSIIVQGKTVMLNPYAQSCTGIPMELYGKIATRLQDSGFTVITSVCGGQVAVNGTVGIDFRLVLDKTM